MVLVYCDCNIIAQEAFQIDHVDQCHNVIKQIVLRFQDQIGSREIGLYIPSSWEYPPDCRSKDHIPICGRVTFRQFRRPVEQDSGDH